MATTDAYEEKDIMVIYVPSIFIHTPMPSEKYDEKRVIMTIEDVIVYMLVKLDSETYMKHMVFDNGNKVFHVVVLRSIYGVIEAALL